MASAPCRASSADASSPASCLSDAIARRIAARSASRQLRPAARFCLGLFERGRRVAREMGRAGQRRGPAGAQQPGEPGPGEGVVVGAMLPLHPQVEAGAARPPAHRHARDPGLRRRPRPERPPEGPARSRRPAPCRMAEGEVRPARGPARIVRREGPGDRGGRTPRGVGVRDAARVEGREALPRPLLPAPLGAGRLAAALGAFTCHRPIMVAARAAAIDRGKGDRARGWGRAARRRRNLSIFLEISLTSAGDCL